MSDAIAGSRCSATTFWQQAAVQAMNTIEHRVDRKRDGQPFFWLDLEADPPALRHQSWDYCDMTGRWVDALLLGRVMTGSTASTETEELLRAFLLSQAGPDGLFYNREASEYGSTRGVDLFCQSRVLLGLLSWWTHTGDAGVEGYLVRLARGLCGLAVNDDGYAYFPGSLWRAGRWLDQSDELGRVDPKVVPALSAPGYRSALLGGLVVAAQAAGLSDVMDVAVGLARHYVDRTGAVGSDGSYVGHTHSGGVLPTAIGVLRAGLATGREELVDWAKRVYEFTVAQATGFGWLPDGLGFPEDYFWSRYCETCALADYLELGILLSECGVGDYWDTVERCARNQLLENQIRTIDGLLPASCPRHIAEAALGGFACAATPNSAVGWTRGLEGCCLGSGLHALYLVWRHAATQQGETVQVNLPITRSTPAAEVSSQDPSAGVLSVEARRPCTVALRLPDCGSDSPVMVNGHMVGMCSPRRYFRSPRLEAGAVMTVAYALPRRTETMTVAGSTYTVRWNGRTVMDIDPVGDLCPTYRRSGDRPADLAAVQAFPVTEAGGLPW